MSERLLATSRTETRRQAQRGHYDLATIHGVIDTAHVAHVGFVVDGSARVLPMAYGRIDNVLYVHGAAANAMLRTSAGAEVCVTITLLDGFVLARSTFKHSMNYRSVVIFGTARALRDTSEKQRALDAIVDHMVAGRSREARAPNPSELRSTLVLAIPITEGSAKVRTGGPNDLDDDLELPIWAGHVPVQLVVGDPVQDSRQAGDGLTAPPASAFEH